MSKELSVFSGCVTKAEKNWVARGINSEVWRQGQLAFKIYKNQITGEPSLNLETLGFYAEVTAQAAEVVEKDRFAVKLPFPLGERIVGVNKYLKIQKCDECGAIEAVMPYVEGKNLLGSAYMLVLNDWQSYFGQVNYYFENRLGVEGIFVSPVNVKPNSNKHLIITDLADDITWVQKTY